MLPDINLLPKYHRQSSIGYILYFIGTIFILLALLISVFYYFYIRGTLGNTSEQLNELVQEQTLLETRLAEIRDADSEVDFQAVYSYVDERIIPTSYLVDDLLERLPEHSYLNNYASDEQTVEIETQFETMEAAAIYVDELRKSDYIEKVYVDAMEALDQDLSTTDEEMETEIDTEISYDIQPRYTVIYTLNINHDNLKEAGELDE